MRTRLRRVTSAELSATEKFEMCEGPGASREQRMEMVAHIAVRVFECRVVGGFVRDWIVNGEAQHGEFQPGNPPPAPWVKEVNRNGKFLHFDMEEVRGRGLLLDRKFRYCIYLNHLYRGLFQKILILSCRLLNTLM